MLTALGRPGPPWTALRAVVVDQSIKNTLLNLKFVEPMPLPMSAKGLQKPRPHLTEQYSVRFSDAFIERIEEFRCEMGLRSRNQAVQELIARGFAAADY